MQQNVACLLQIMSWARHNLKESYPNIIVRNPLWVLHSVWQEWPNCSKKNQPKNHSTPDFSLSASFMCVFTYWMQPMHFPLKHMVMIICSQPSVVFDSHHQRPEIAYWSTSCSSQEVLQTYSIIVYITLNNGRGGGLCCCYGTRLGSK